MHPRSRAPQQRPRVLRTVSFPYPTVIGVESDNRVVRNTRCIKRCQHFPEHRVHERNCAIVMQPHLLHGRVSHRYPRALEPPTLPKLFFGIRPCHLDGVHARTQPSKFFLIKKKSITQVCMQEGQQQTQTLETLTKSLKRARRSSLTIREPRSKATL